MKPGSLQIIHSLPGRLRVRVKGLEGNKAFARLMQKTFVRNPNVLEFKANSLTGKALIIFDLQRKSKTALVKELKQAIDAIVPRVYSPGKTRSVPKKWGDRPVYEPEELPIQLQITQVVGTGLVLVLLLIKRVFWGKSLMASSGKMHYLAAATTIITGYPILRSGLEGLLVRKKLNNDFLISAATIVSLLLRESITGLVVIWLVNLSTLFQTFTLEKSRKAIKAMLQGKEDTAWLEIDGTLVSVPIESLEKGNVIGSHTGEKIPVDGEVISGEAAVSQAIITGESMPVTKKTGDKVFAGSIVEQGQLRIRAEKVGKDTSLARIIYLVEEASEVRAPIENIADRYSEKIVPLSFGLAGLVYLLTRDFKRSMTMLIVACPCAAGLATPTAVSAAMGNAAKKGILVKGGSYLEKIGQTDVVLFDKTGTLTEGKPAVREIISLHKDYSQERVIQLTASLETQTNHPLAAAVVQHAQTLKLPLLKVEDKVVIIGQGVTGTVEDKLILAGNEQLMKENGISIRRGKEKGYRLNLQGQTIIYVAQDRTLLGILGVSDKLREESPRAIKRLRQEGVEKIGLITGDCAETGELVGRELGLDQVWSHILPEGKVQIVEKFKKDGLVVTMVGEGINDSPALAKADVGIAMGTGGTDVAIETAGVVLANDNPEKVADLISLSNHTMEVVKQNFSFAVGINALGLALGAAKIISPLTAAILHNLSTFGVVVNSSRLLAYENSRKGRKYLGRNQGIGNKNEVPNGTVKRNSGNEYRASERKS